MPEITREVLIETLEEIALLLELKGENPFKIRAYRSGAALLQDYEGDILAFAREKKLREIRGIGDALQDKLHELVTTGELRYHQDLRAGFPETLFELFELPGLGPKKIKVLHETLGIGSIADLQQACEKGSVEELPGFGKKTAEKILQAIAHRAAFANRFRLGSVAPLAETLMATLKDHPEVTQASLAGSYRRSKETLHDLDFLVATSSPGELTKFFAGLPEVVEVIACGDTKASVYLARGLQADLRAVSPEEYPFALQYFTGSKEHNVALRARALKQGLSMNEYGFTVVGKKAVEPTGINEEGNIYQALGLEYIPPELRENRGELEAADAGGLPRLVELENLRGTFHNHTRASDGQNTLAEMAAAARELGLQYLGIADHSKSSFQANGLDADRLLAQVSEIKALNRTFSDFRLLAGSEVDILKDGSLDFSDEVLAQLDYCVASIHSVFNLSEKEMTARLVRAMENEQVTILGHPTGRLLLKRDGYRVDFEKVIDCAAETGTVIELNCNPARLDMDWRHWRRAADKGVLCAINPDAHRTEQLQFLAYGVRLARKGWLEKEHVLNTRDWSDLERWLGQPKGNR